MELEPPGTPAQLRVTHQDDTLQLGCPPVVKVEVAGLHQDLVHVGVDGDLEGKHLERVHQAPQLTALEK